MRPRQPLDLTINLSVTAKSAAMGKTMLHSMNDNDPLSGLTVLLVEDDLFLAMALEDTLVGMGAVVVDVCHTLDEGWRELTPTISRWRDLTSVWGRIR